MHEQYHCRSEHIETLIEAESLLFYLSISKHSYHLHTGYPWVRGPAGPQREHQHDLGVHRGAERQVAGDGAEPTSTGGPGRAGGPQDRPVPLLHRPSQVKEGKVATDV